MNRVNANAIPEIDLPSMPEQRRDNSRLLLMSEQLKLRFKELGIDQRAKKIIIDELLQNNALMNDTQAQWIFNEAHQDIHNDSALTGIIEGDIVHVILDRTFVDIDNRRWIIDFAYSEEIVIAEHRSRLEKYAKIMGLLEAREIWIGIYSLSSKKWIEWKFC